MAGTKLLPCPFCGGGWLYETWRNGYCDETPTMFCNSCKAVVTWEQVEEEGVNDETRTFVREHWNTRAERTCMNTAPVYLDFLCSECGFVHYHSDENDMDGGNEWNYCPNCGARVRRGE